MKDSINLSQELEEKLLKQETELETMFLKIGGLIYEKENLTKELEAKSEELDKLKGERALLQIEKRGLLSSSNHFEKLYREVYSNYYELAIKRSSQNLFSCCCLAVSFYLAYRGLRSLRTDLPELPPKKLSLIENFFLYFTDVENQ